MAVVRKKKRNPAPVLVSLVCMLVLLGVWALERFIIPNSEGPIGLPSDPPVSSGSGSSEPDSSGNTSSEPEIVYTEIVEDPENGYWYYKSEAVEIIINKKYLEFTGSNGTTKKKSNTFICEIKIADGHESALSRITASKGFGTGGAYRQNTFDMASENNAILAITGDQYGYVKTGIEVVHSQLYRYSVRDKFFVNVKHDNTMEILKAADYDDKDSALSLLENGTKFTLDFGPALIVDGEKITDFSAYSKIGNWNPRSGIGYVSKNHYYFVVIDGARNDTDNKESGGAGLKHLRDVFADLGCTAAYNLDGGSSTTLIFNGKRINNLYENRINLYDLVAVVDIPVLPEAGGDSTQVENNSSQGE
ncbi:MAG: phosphodiester glycosidase family protein [Clostridia bacterium]|nr:phosphodiester glycosidase family protein [Clostridia bacterium]